MTQMLNHRFSPLEQARRQSEVEITGTERQLSARDQATLKRILTGKCDFVPNVLFGRADAKKRIFDNAPAIRRPDTSWYHPVMENLTDARSANTSGNVLLTAAE